ncbi:MAG: hypothetical protein LBD48_00890, partial [Treponema sp.]|nr:hypothetical protein [Treponema sp.]
MAKISDNERYKYLDKIKIYKAAIETMLKHEQETLAAIKRNGERAALKRFALADEMLNLASNYMIINGVSVPVLKVKNEDALNDARKSLYKSIIYLEQIVGNLIDVPFSDNEEKLAEIESVDPARRYLLIKKMGLAIQLLENAYGHNTKWRWAFVEIEGRYAAAAKNIMDLRRAITNTNPQSPGYEPTVYHLRLIKKLLM